MWLFQKGELKQLLPFYISEFLAGFGTLAASYMFLFFYRDLGLSFVEISLTSISFFVGNLIFEIPSGAFADAYGRKRSVLIGLGLPAICIALMAFVHSVLGLVILFFLFGIGVSFQSGAWQAWAVDNLRHHKKENLIQTFFGKSLSFHSLGMIFGPLTAAVLVNYVALRWLFLIDGAFFFLALIPLWLTHEHWHKPVLPPLFKMIKKTIKLSLKAGSFVFTHHNLRALLIGNAVGFLSFSAETGWQPLFALALLPLAGIGVVNSIQNVIRTLVAPFSTVLTKRMSHVHALVLIALFHLLIVLLLFFVEPGKWLWVVIVYLGIAFIVLNGPVLADLQQRYTPSKIRATVLSFFTLSCSIVGVVGFLIGGFILDAVGPKYAIIIMAFFAVPEMLAYLWIKD